MKQILTIALLLSAIFSYGQSIPKDGNLSTKGYDDDTSRKTWTLIFPQSNFAYVRPHTLLIFGHDLSSNPDFRIDSAGNLFYRPSAFCHCDSCRRQDTLKFYRNIFTL